VTAILGLGPIQIESWVLAAERATAKGMAVAVDQQVVLASGLASVCGVRAG
jgi:hypothetical protein